MDMTSRRRLLKAAAAAGGAAAVGFGAILQSDRALARTLSQPGAGHNGHGQPISGAQANATVTFGAWTALPTDAAAPIDRFGSVPNNRNAHVLLPYEVNIREGGSVNFVITGVHLVLIYDDGVEPGDIDTTLLIPATPGLAPPLINDPNRRIYRGLDPRTLFYASNVRVLDRVECVQFPNAGRYLAMCGLLPHFADGMVGYINVRGGQD